MIIAGLCFKKMRDCSTAKAARHRPRPSEAYRTMTFLTRYGTATGKIELSWRSWRALDGRTRR
jgi:hypothetical protein